MQTLRKIFPFSKIYEMDIHVGHLLKSLACFMLIYKRYQSQSERALNLLYFIIIIIINIIDIIFIVLLLLSLLLLLDRTRGQRAHRRLSLIPALINY